MEANREAAMDALDMARAKKDEGDYASAVRLAEKSIKLSPEFDKAHAFLGFLRKFGPESDSAKGIARVMQAADHYAVMELSADADEKTVERAYKQLALKIHPDKNAAEGAHEAFQKLVDAWSTLSTPATRHEYDTKLRYARPPLTPAPAGFRPRKQSAAQQPPQYRPAGWQAPPRAATAGTGPASGSASGSAFGGGNEELQREIAQLRQELSDARAQKSALIMLRSQLKQRTAELEIEKEARQRDLSQWQELQRSWHQRHAEAESRIRDANELEAQLRRVARLDKGELENLRVRHDALLKRQANLEAALEAERAATHALRGALASAGGQAATDGSANGGANGVRAAEHAERRGGEEGHSADGGAGRMLQSRFTHAIQLRRASQGTAWRLDLTPCQADGRAAVQLTFADGTRSAVMMGRAHGGRDPFRLTDPRISRSHVRLSAGDGLASAGEHMVAIATAVGANAIGVRRNPETSTDNGSIESAAKGEAIELRHGDRLLLLAEEPQGTRFEYLVSLRPVPVASGGDGSSAQTPMVCASPEQGFATMSLAQAAELAASPAACGGARQASSDAPMPDASELTPADHAVPYQQHTQADGPPSADDGQEEAVHAQQGLAEGTGERQSESQAPAMLGEAVRHIGSPVAKRMRLGVPESPVTGILSASSMGASLEDPIEL
jgi:curved DNA-binding protein CbpA